LKLKRINLKIKKLENILQIFSELNLEIHFQKINFLIFFEIKKIFLKKIWKLFSEIQIKKIYLHIFYSKLKRFYYFGNFRKLKLNFLKKNSNFFSSNFLLLKMSETNFHIFQIDFLFFNNINAMWPLMHS